MDRFLEGKTAIVTGGTRGIGRAIAETLVRCGASVAICGRGEDAVRRAVAEIGRSGKVVGRAADVSKPEDVAALFRCADEQLGNLDVLVNNAGVGTFASVADLSIESWRTVIGTNLDGVFYCSHEAIGRFQRNGGGFIINISSLAGKNPFSGGAAYNASKFGLNGFSEAMMLDHRYENIRVSYIMPGSVATDFSPKETKADWKIAPEDIAEIVLMLLRMPQRTLVSRVEVRPSKPRKG